jgi:hypothetical protein
LSKLIPVRYSRRNYPPGVKAELQEVAGHFDIKGIKPDGAYSLHTEYSYGKRKLDNVLLTGLDTIKKAHQDLIPKLWFNEKWSLEFLEFIKRLVDDNSAPEIVEIHPPFNDYCGSIGEFLDSYTGFEEALGEIFSDTKIFIENRCGSMYRGGRFLVSRLESIAALCEAIGKRGLKLRLVLDFPQLFTAYNLGPGKFTEEKIIKVIRSLGECRDYIAGIHLWGKKLNDKGRAIPHIGDLDSYFLEARSKEVFLRELFDLLDDGRARFFVPEVNSGDEDLRRIVEDLVSVGFGMG